MYVYTNTHYIFLKYSKIWSTYNWVKGDNSFKSWEKKVENATQPIVILSIIYDTCIYLHDHWPQQHGVIDANLSVTSTKESYSAGKLW